MKPERKIAIAIITKFREHLDLVVKPRQPPEIFLQKQADNAILFAFGDLADTASEVFQEMESHLKEAFTNINNDMLEYVSAEYDVKMTYTVDQAMARLEEHFSLEFTEEELEELVKIIENPVFEKFLSKSAVFNILDDEKMMLVSKINEAFVDFSKDEDRRQEIEDAVRSVTEKFKKPTDKGWPGLQDIEEDDDGLYLDFDDDDDDEDDLF